MAPDLDSDDDAGSLSLANERLRAFNQVLLAQSEMLLTQQEELREANRELARINAAKDELLGLLSHELRTPLAIAKNGLAILHRRRAGPLTESQSRFVELSLQATDNLARTLDELLDWQKLMAGKALCSPEPRDLRLVMNDACGDQRKRYAEKGVALVCEPGSEPLLARYDHERVRLVLANLLVNACTFTPAGGRVVVTAELVGAAVRITVADTGRGIADEHREVVFDPFVQLESGLTRETSGTGLGLSICKQIVENGHGGRIRVVGDESGGACFEVEFPRLEA